MKIKNYKQIIYWFLGSVLTIIAYLIFINSESFVVFSDWASRNFALYAFFLYLVKVAGIVWPPIPGGVFTLGSIPVIGWVNAYGIDLLGSLTGSVIAYWIAKRYGLKVVSKIFDDITLKKVQRIKVREDKQFEAVFLFRFFGGTIVELVCYAAGLLRVRFRSFLIATVLSHLLIGIPTYYFADSLFFGRNVVMAISFLIIFVLLFIFLRKRYFRYNDD